MCFAGFELHCSKLACIVYTDANGLIQQESAAQGRIKEEGNSRRGGRVVRWALGCLK